MGLLLNGAGIETLPLLLLLPSRWRMGLLLNGAGIETSFMSTQRANAVYVYGPAP